jgi:hypothetical protein
MNCDFATEQSPFQWGSGAQHVDIKRWNEAELFFLHGLKIRPMTSECKFSVMLPAFSSERTPTVRTSMTVQHATNSNKQLDRKKMRCLDHAVCPPDKAQNKNETCLTTVQPSYQNNAVAPKPLTGDLLLKTRVSLKLSWYTTGTHPWSHGMDWWARTYVKIRCQ